MCKKVSETNSVVFYICPFKFYLCRLLLVHYTCCLLCYIYKIKSMTDICFLAFDFAFSCLFKVPNIPVHICGCKTVVYSRKEWFIPEKN